MKVASSQDVPGGVFQRQAGGALLRRAGLRGRAPCGDQGSRGGDGGGAGAVLGRWPLTAGPLCPRRAASAARDG